MADPTIQAQLAALHGEQTKLRKRFLALKRQTGTGPFEDVALSGPDGELRLSALFGDKADLIVIHNMGRSCSYCTMWADGFQGWLPHLLDRAAFVVVSPDAPAEQQAFAQSRGWTFPMASSQGTSFKRDLGYETKDGSQMPGYSTFHKGSDGIVHVASDFFGPGDEYCGVWHFFDLLQDGLAGWQPQLSY